MAGADGKTTATVEPAKQSGNLNDAVGGNASIPTSDVMQPFRRNRFLIVGLLFFLVIAVSVAVVLVITLRRDPEHEEATSNLSRPTDGTEDSFEPSAARTAPPTAIPSLRPASKMPSTSFTFAPSKAPLSATSPPTMQTSSTPTERASFTVEGSFELLDTVPHDVNAFTQGLELVPDNPLQYFESTGLYGRSSVRRVDLRSGQVLQRHDLNPRYFGEGLTNFDGKLIQLTWQEQTAFIYNATNLVVLGEFDYTGNTNGEGWGICYVDATNTFLVTDGSSNLHTWDATSFELLEQTPVFLQADGLSAPQEVRNLNELEWDVHSQTVLANIWLEDNIVRIDPVTGMVLARYDLSSLFRPPEADVLNGIAITDTPNEIWVTGKLWPDMYLIRLLD